VQKAVGVWWESGQVWLHRPECAITTDCCERCCCGPRDTRSLNLRKLPARVRSFAVEWGSGEVRRTRVGWG
jgi:hypothetical protein